MIANGQDVEQSRAVRETIVDEKALVEHAAASTQSAPMETPVRQCDSEYADS
jgi:hypothetical protein